MKNDTETRITLRNRGWAAAKFLRLSLWPVLGFGEREACARVQEALGVLRNSVTPLGLCRSVLASLVNQHQVLMNWDIPESYSTGFGSFKKLRPSIRTLSKPSRITIKQQQGKKPQQPDH